MAENRCARASPSSLSRASPPLIRAARERGACCGRASKFLRSPARSAPPSRPIRPRRVSLRKSAIRTRSAARPETGTGEGSRAGRLRRYGLRSHAWSWPRSAGGRSPLAGRWDQS
eukprot:6205232-Pleurochrysis_carterae.AAC.2